MSSDVHRDVSEAREDLKRVLKRTRWWEPLLGAVGVLALNASQSVELGTYSPVTRLLILLAPLVLIGGSAWRQYKAAQRESELEREIRRWAASAALLLTVLVLIVLGQFETATGTTPIRLRDIWIIPLLLYVVALVTRTARLARQ